MSEAAGNWMVVDNEKVKRDGFVAASPAAVPVNCSDVCRELCLQLASTGQALGKICGDTDPLFVQTGRDLQAVAMETRTLTETIQRAAILVGGSKNEQGALGNSGQLVKNILERLTINRQEIEQDLKQIRDLVVQISDCRRINDAIDRISSSFRAVRINIRIQCSAQLISEDIFKDVTEDIDALAKTLTRITKQIKIDLTASAKNLVALERIVSSCLLSMDRVSANAGRVVTRAYGDIRQLLQGTETMIREASRRSAVIADKIDEIVVSIQFHDSLSQRTNHILLAFADITKLCTPGAQGIDQSGLGSAFLILDLQHRQLAHIIDEISTIHTRIKQSFSIIGAEVRGLNSILLDGQFKAVGSEQFLDSLYTSLQKSLFQLFELLNQGEEMIEQINTSAADTRNVADRLVEIMQDVREMRDETRLQAVNTIIMASNLGQKGRTIQVLAKEISTLSDQTSELVTDVEILQLAVNQKVEKLCQSWDKNDSSTSRIALHAEITSMDGSYRELEGGIADLSAQIDSSCTRIETVHGRLLFIQHLRDGLRTVAARVEEARDTLLPWRDQAVIDNTEVQQLIQRYTMEQERLIHLFDRVEEEQARQIDEEIFF